MSFFTSGVSLDPSHRGVSFDPTKDIPSLKGRVVLVTGGNSGLGKSSVLQLARHEPALIFLTGRDAQKTVAAVEDIKKQVPGARVEPLELDLASFESVKNAAKIVTAKTDRLDILMLNAGIMFAAPEQTKEGYETHFGTNHMGHALLTKLLLPTLLRTAEQPGADVRVVVLSSAGIGFAHPGGISYDDRKSSGEGKSANLLYGQSKLANALFAQELARRYPSLTVASVHPGIVITDLGRQLQARHPLLGLLSPVANFLLTKPDQGAKNQLWASVTKDVVSGEFYTPVGVCGTIKGVDMVRNKEWAAKLWDWTEEELKSIEL